MDAKTLISRIKNPGLVVSDDLGQWKELAERFPYFSIVRYLECVNEVGQGKEVGMEFVSMYKQNPILFAQHLLPPKDPNAMIHTMVDIPEYPVSDRTMEAVIEPLPYRPSEEEPVSVVEPEYKVEAVESIIPDIPVWNEPAVPEIVESVDIELYPEPEMSPVVEDYISSQAEGIANEHEPILMEELNITETEDKSLMVMMSFMDWIQHFHKKNEEELEEEKEKKALKAAWQKEKLNAIVDEESEEIPESIFKQAMESVSAESGIVSESLAQLLAQQGKTDKAIDMYKKLSLRNPEKSAYFADLIRKINLLNQ